MKGRPSSIQWLCLAVALCGLSATGVSVAQSADLISSCENCHGVDGASKEPEIPIIGGLSAQYIIDSFAAYADETRPCEEVKHIAGPQQGEVGDMCKAVEALSDDEIQEVADHFAGKPFVRATQEFDAALADAGKSLHGLHCKKCHEDGGSSPDDDAGILAGQWMPYLTEQLEDFASGKRAVSDKMKVKLDKLSADDIKAVIQYYGSFQ